MAYKIGTQQCVLTDGDTDTLAEMRNNVQLNVQQQQQQQYEYEQQQQYQQQHHQQHSNDKCQCHCHQLRWGHARTIQALLHKYGTFDVIMGSDIIYVEEIIEPLFDTVSQLLTLKDKNKNNNNNNDGDDNNDDNDDGDGGGGDNDGGGCFLLAYARRNVSIDLVLACATRYGFQWVEPEDAEGVFVFTRI